MKATRNGEIWQDLCGEEMGKKLDEMEKDDEISDEMEKDREARNGKRRQKKWEKQCTLVNSFIVHCAND